MRVETRRIDKETLRRPSFRYSYKESTVLNTFDHTPHLVRRIIQRLLTLTLLALRLVVINPLRS